MPIAIRFSFLGDNLVSIKRIFLESSTTDHFYSMGQVFFHDDIPTMSNV
ncbi:MAG: hypothetical protein HUJ22_10100 [Gracilimonas sp.]|nr:hypothetical protein [Gracilimonas sp.]MBD3616912.1 hypothetical protein [Gracilimonas sp.]